MPTKQRARSRRSRRRPIRAAALGLGTLLLVVALVGGAAMWLTQLAQSNHVRTRISAPAVAPPGPGAPTPALIPTQPARTQPDLLAWANTTSPRVAVPAPALVAYGYAAARQDERDPACRIGWTTLAGIGAVESRHGSHGGASLDPMGRALPPIIGVSLDGAPGLAEIPDTDHGALDGDPKFDRAVGPLQFIPETWRKWGVDADGDGVADPNDINDAALTAARYLCAGEPDMSTAAGWRAGLFHYNQSAAYANDVLQYAVNYAAGLRG